MAVFTSITPHDLDTLLADYDVGHQLSFAGISAGIENTNYFVTTTGGEFVLTLFEKLTSDQLPFYLELMDHLGRKGVPCARPIALRSGALQTSLCGRPAALSVRLRGAEVTEPSPAHCRVLGRALAQAHLAVADFRGTQPNLRGLAWWQETIPALLRHVGAEQARLLSDTLDEQKQLALAEGAGLPHGAVHADLFRDNALFEQTAQDEPPRLGGFIDFYFAGVDTFVFDLAVVANDWCLEFEKAPGEGREDLCPSRLTALLEGYEELRPLQADEKRCWPAMLRAAALRFWVSRLDDWHRPRAAAMLTPKDPTHFERILLSRWRTAPCT